MHFEYIQVSKCLKNINNLTYTLFHLVQQAVFLLRVAEVKGRVIVALTQGTPPHGQQVKDLFV